MPASTSQENSSSVDLSAALSDVRRAYRLLHAYQRRVFDVVEEFVAAFDDRQYYWWRPVHYSKPGSSNPLERWAWNMLPMVKTSFLYLGAGTDHNLTRPGEWMLELLLESDSGFELFGNAEPMSNDFDDVENCRTTLRAIAWCPTKATKLNWLHGFWDEVEWPDRDKEVIEHDDPPLRVIADTFDLVALADKRAVRTAAAGFKLLAASCRGTPLT